MAVVKEAGVECGSFHRAVSRRRLLESPADMMQPLVSEVSRGTETKKILEEIFQGARSKARSLAKVFDVKWLIQSRSNQIPRLAQTAMTPRDSRRPRGSQLLAAIA